MKKNARVIRVAPHGLSKSAYVVLLAGASLCTVGFAASVAAVLCSDAAGLFVGLAVFFLIACVCLWPCLWYYGHHLPKFLISLNETEKEITVTTPQKSVTASFVEVSYTVTASFAARPT